MPWGKRNSNTVPQDCQLLLHTHLFLVSQSNASLGSAEKGFCRSNEGSKSSDLKRQRLPKRATSPNHTSPAMLGWNIRDSRVRGSKNEPSICHHWPVDGGATWQGIRAALGAEGGPEPRVNKDLSSTATEETEFHHRKNDLGNRVFPRGSRWELSPWFQPEQRTRIRHAGPLTCRAVTLWERVTEQQRTGASLYNESGSLDSTEDNS